MRLQTCKWLVGGNPGYTGAAGERGPTVKTTIRHVHNADFFALASSGVPDLESFRRAVDRLLSEMGSPAHHDILFDLRGAGEAMLPEQMLIQALAELRSRGVGLSNRLAILVDPGDLLRWDRIRQAETIAALTGLSVRLFSEYGEAMDWLSDAHPGA